MIEMNEKILQEAVNNAEKARQDLKDSINDAIVYHEELIKKLLDKINTNK